MQNQLTPGQSNLQQPVSNLQQNSNSLQQSGAPTTSSDVSTVLSDNSINKTLQVQSTQTDPSAPSQTYLPSNSASVWIVPFAFVLATVLALVFWTWLRQLESQLDEEEAPVVAEPPKPVQAPKKPKAGKKTTRRQRQNKR